MNRPVVVGAGVLGIALAACSGDGGAAGSDDPGEALAERVVALLEADGDAVDGELDGAEVSCPDVPDPDAGDRATCNLRFGGGRDVDVDVRFEDDGAITVVAVVPG